MKAVCPVVQNSYIKTTKFSNFFPPFSFLKISTLLGFEVLTAVVKSSIFCDITPCSRLIVNRCFGGTCRLCLQGRTTRQFYILVFAVGYNNSCYPRVGNTRRFVSNYLFVCHSTALLLRDFIESMIGSLLNMEELMDWELVGETKVLEENYPSLISSTTNPTWPDLESNPGRRGAGD
jgi:hypothetical protein